ncbi:MAG: hypothetical protein A2Z24_00190 [Candidatus Woykebacteria bacterium RBG_16_44_10]|uniref:VWFA domain-containing protein n=1 Tax=Candidatus Woykebacteria bacterium RBG_16_44_10 TaxID=1802597 RepID=A0A1G1WFP1_9BACT|nr:MAG: hypothetical protein A2Z24_00190 [Candidatus Woykebacteria bacterium RBG_16_44_10]
MRKGLIVSTIFISTLAFGLVLSSDSAFAQTKATNKVIYSPGDPIDITITVPGGTTLYVQPTDIVILFDRSNSMLARPMSAGDPTPRIDATIKAINKFLDTAYSIGGANRPRVGLATYGTSGYWEVNFTNATVGGVTYANIRNRLPVIRAQMVTKAAGNDDFWECTSSGEGVDLAVQKLVADPNPNPNFIVLAGDGAENGKHYWPPPPIPPRDVWDYPPLGFNSRFLEETTAINTAQTNKIKIHSIGLSDEILDDQSGVWLGYKCGKAYGNPPFNGYAWRTGEKHFRDYISSPTGGSYKRITTTTGIGSLNNYFVDLFKKIATDYTIRVRERFNSDYFDPITDWGSGRPRVIARGNGCSGVSGASAASPVPVPAGGVYSFWVRWNSIPQGENRCIIIRTYIKATALPGEDLPVDVYPDTRAEIININGSITNVDIPQAIIDILAGAWFQTTDGDVGSCAQIRPTIAPPIGFSADYLVIQNNSTPTSNFTSELGWLVWGYNPLNIGPRRCSVADWSMYTVLANKFKLNTSNTITSLADIPVSGGNRVYYINGDLTINSAVNFTQDPAVVFVKTNLNIEADLIVGPDTGLILVVGDTSTAGHVKIKENVNQADGVFIFDGDFDVNGSVLPLVIHGAVIGGSEGGSFKLKRDFKSADNLTTPSERIVFEPKYLWLFRDIIGDTKTIFKEVAP